MSKIDRFMKISLDLSTLGVEQYSEAKKDKAVLFQQTPDDCIARETFENNAAKVFASVLRRKLERIIKQLEGI